MPASFNLRSGQFMGVTVLCDEPTDAARYVRETMNAKDCDQEFCRDARFAIDGEDNECERVTAGGLTYQFVRPTSLVPGSEEFFAANGSWVYCYTLAVDDVKAAADDLVAAGAKLVELREGANPSLYSVLSSYEGDAAVCAMVDAREQCGLVFELVSKKLDLPCYTGVRFPEDIGVFMHSEIVVVDPVASRKWMCSVMGAEVIETHISRIIGTGSACTEDEDDSELAAEVAAAAAEAGTKPGCEHVLIGGFVFQLITPFPHLTGWQNNLERHGNCTNNICYHLNPLVRSVPDELALMERYGSRELVEEGSEHGNSWDYSFADLYGEDGGDPKRVCHCTWIDAEAQCGIYWEFLPMVYRWNCSTGYFQVDLS